MIDTDKYEGHTEGMWIVEGGSVYLQDEVTPIARMDRDTNHTTPTERDSNAQLIADAPLLLAEIKRLQKLEAAVVGSWMRACDHRGPWHKALRYPCVELGYLTYNAEGLINYELSEEYQNMAKEWVKEHYGDEEE